MPRTTEQSKAIVKNLRSEDIAWGEIWGDLHQSGGGGLLGGSGEKRTFCITRSDFPGSGHLGVLFDHFPCHGK